MQPRPLRVRDAIRKHVWEAVWAASVEVPDKFEARTAMRVTITEDATADILAARPVRA